MNWTISSEKHVEQMYRMAYTIGAFLGDGNLHAYSAKKNGKWYALQCVRFGKPDLDVLERVQKEIEDVFERKYAIMNRTLKSGLKFYLLHAYRKDIFVFFSVNTKERTEIPECFYSASDEVKRELLCGLMDSDGYIAKRKDVNQWAAGFGNTSKAMVEGLATLFNQLGVPVGKISEYTKGEYKTLYTVRPKIRDLSERGPFFYSKRKWQKMDDCISHMLGSETLYVAPASTG